MKPLLFLPLFFLIQPWCSAWACDSSELSGSGATSRSPAAAPASRQSDADGSAKKKSSPVSSPAPSAPKRDRAAPPAYLFME